MSAASSNTLVPPLIRPYPFSPKNISQTPPPPHRRESICEYLVAKKTYRTGRAGDPCAGVRILCFPKPSVQGFPTAADPADRSCRYLVQPPTVLGLARLWGYQRPPRGGRGRRRRACERTPLRGRRRCAAGGRPQSTVILMLHTHPSMVCDVSACTHKSNRKLELSTKNRLSSYVACYHPHSQFCIQ